MAKDRLSTYRKKRDFSKTGEPSGATAQRERGGHRFVVQRHRARRLHYDLRLEHGGVLVSWSVPKGPSLDPDVRRLAVHVEDHPLEYFDFEGVIPEGEYGAGDVIVWDWGTWEPAGADDPGKALAQGELHFDLHGDKLDGRFVLVRRGQGDRRNGKEQWLLIHKRDEFAEEGWDPEDHPSSVKSGRTNDEVAETPEDEWTRDRPTVASWARREPWPALRDEEIAALHALAKEGAWEFVGHEVRLTNLDKALFPGTEDRPPVTKRDFIGYHAQVARFMLPYLTGRPVNARRYPDGINANGFWHKARPDYAPDFVGAWSHPEAAEGETQVYSVVDNPAALVWMANHAAIELNPWTSRIPDIHEPTWALIDIDPGPETSLDSLLTLARLYRTALDHLGVEGMPKATGRRGIHVCVPVAAGYSFEDTRQWVEAISRSVGGVVPDLVSWAWSKKERGGMARLDYTQNAINKTLVAPFSARPSPGAPVSVPITWDELDDPEFRPDRWSVHDVLDRLERVGDPLAPLIGLQQRLPEVG